MHSNTSHADLLRRIERLERENRRFKQTASLVFLGVASLLVVAQVSPKSTAVEAERFLVKDRKGNVRAQLGVDSLGRPSLTIGGVKEKPRIEMGLGPFGSALLTLVGGPFFADVPDSTNVADPTKRINSRIQLHARTAFSSHIEIRNVEEHLAFGAQLEVPPSGRPRILLFDNRRVVHLDKASSLLGIDTALGPELAGLVGSVPRAVLALDRDGKPSLLLLDDSLETRAVLGDVTLQEPRSGAVEHRPPSSLVFFDKDGMAVWKAP